MLTMLTTSRRQKYSLPGTNNHHTQINITLYEQQILINHNALHPVGDALIRQQHDTGFIRESRRDGGIPVHLFQQ
jgi:hypothetical protein